MQYRSRNDIAAAILEIALEGAIKTKIMYKAFLSFPQLKEYLSVLNERKLLEYNSTDRSYYTTPKGKYFLKTYSEVGSLLAQPRQKTSAKRKPVPGFKVN